MNETRSASTRRLSFPPSTNTRASIYSLPKLSHRKKRGRGPHSRMITRHHSSSQSSSNSRTFLSNPLLSSPSEFETHERLTTEPDLICKTEEKRKKYKKERESQ